MIISLLASLIPAGLVVVFFSIFFVPIRKILFKAILYGIVAAIGAAGIEFLIGNFVLPKSQDFIGVSISAFIEEIIKLGAVYLCYKDFSSRIVLSESKSDTESKQIIFFTALLVAVGFASFENWFMLSSGASTIFMRLITSLPLHVGAGLLGAQALYGKKIIFPPLVMAGLSHSIFNTTALHVNNILVLSGIAFALCILSFFLFPKKVDSDG